MGLVHKFEFVKYPAAEMVRQDEEGDDDDTDSLGNPIESKDLLGNSAARRDTAQETRK
jgi:hypothetical protein